MSNGVKRRNMRLKNCLFTSLSISSILLFASGQQIFAEETEVNDVITPATPEVRQWYMQPIHQLTLKERRI